MRSLGLSVQDLTPCDMTVCSANNSNMAVLGAVLVEFSSTSQQTSKQIVYICEGVVGTLLSLEACIDLGLVDEKFPRNFSTQSCLKNSTAGSYG